MTAHYLLPGAPIPPPPAPQANSYRQPSGPPPQSMPSPPPPPPESPLAPARDQDPHRGTMLTEWRRHHADTWVRADALHPAIRRMIDERQRLSAIRQKLRQLVAHTPELEAKVVGNAARRVVLYRLTEL